RAETGGFGVARSGGGRSSFSAPSSSFTISKVPARPRDRYVPAKRSSKEARDGAANSNELLLSSTSEARTASSSAACQPELIGICDPRKVPIASATIPAQNEPIPG